jgi:hypothetical protein
MRRRVNEMLTEAKAALEEIQQAKMPGAARVIAIKMLKRIDEYENAEATADCTLCSAEESAGFYTGCMVADGHAPEWQCDNGKLTKPA